MSARIFGSECIVRRHLWLDRCGFPLIHFGKGGRTKLAAVRIVYRLFVGEAQSWQVVSHRCGNRACINPAHLYLRDRIETATDRHDRKLTAKDYYYIRRSPLSLGQLESKFSYSKRGLSKIRRREVRLIERFSLRYALLILWEHVTRKGRRRREGAS